MTERSSAALVGVASARHGSAARSLAARLRARLLTALSGLGPVLGRGAACAGLRLALLRGVLLSALVVALPLSTLGTLASGDSFHVVRSAAAGSICSKSMAVGFCYPRCDHFRPQMLKDAKNQILKNAKNGFHGTQKLYHIAPTVSRGRPRRCEDSF